MQLIFDLVSDIRHHPTVVTKNRGVKYSVAYAVQTIIGCAAPEYNS